MEMMMRPLRAEERKYTYAQSHQLTMQTGMIGYLRGDFDSDGAVFYTTWFDAVAERKTEDFKAEFDSVVNALRFDAQYGGLLANRRAMRDYGRSNPDCAFPGNCGIEYGFRVDTEKYVYLLRCNPQKGDYNFYCWCYEEKWLDRNIQKARQGIRFIDPHYKELFCIPDGDRIRIFTGEGETRDRSCRYIDEYHLEVGNGSGSNLYHICEFAERLEQTGGTVIPMRASLPEQCFSTLPSTGELIQIRKGEKGYLPCYDFSTGNQTQNRLLADDRNAKSGVTKAQEAAMLAGSMFGWQIPAADPENYDEQGQLIKSKPRERGDAR